MLDKLPLKIQYKLVVQKKYDIEIAFNRGAAARIISGSTNKKAKKIVWVHNDYMSNNNPLAGFCSLKDAQEGYKKFDRIICVSEQARTSFEQRFGVGYPLEVCYNIVNANKIRQLSKAEEIPKDKFTIIAVGRLCEAKNYRLLMEAVEMLNQRNLKLCCKIIGDGELRNELIKIRDGKKLNNVFFVGKKDNPYVYMRCADLYVSSSVYEGLSTTTIEALILGKPCVVTNCAGMSTILGSNNDYGVIVPINAKALADVIEKMATDAKYYSYYQIRAAERAEIFNPENAFRKIEELL